MPEIPWLEVLVAALGPRVVERGPKKRAALYLRRAEEAEETEPLSALGLEPLDAAFTTSALAALLAQAMRAGQACPRCGARLAAVYFRERETYYCLGCQTGGKLYADRRLSRLLK